MLNAGTAVIQLCSVPEDHSDLEPVSSHWQRQCRAELQPELLQIDDPACLRSSTMMNRSKNCLKRPKEETWPGSAGDDRQRVPCSIADILVEGWTGLSIAQSPSCGTKNEAL